MKESKMQNNNYENKVNQENLVEFGCFDYNFTNLFSIYTFEDILNVDDLQKSLTKTISSKCPIMSSVIREINGRLFFQITDPSICKISVVEEKENLLAAYHFDEKTGVCYENKDAKKFIKNVEMIETMDNCMKPVLGSPLMKITLKQLKKGGSVLFVSICHALADANAFARFMKCWSEIHTNGNSEYVLPFSRTALTKMTDGFDLKKSKYLENLKEFHTIGTKPEEIGFIVLPSDSCVLTKQNFSPEDLKKLKKAAKGDYSSNVCVCAYMWILNTALSGKKDDDIAPFHIIFDTRNRFSKLKANFFGNSASYANIDSTVGKVLSEEYSTIVSMIKDLIDKCSNQELIQDSINCCVKESLTDIWSKCRRKSSFYMNDWRIKDRLRPSFGKCKCSRVIWNIHDSGFPQLATSMMASNGGIDVLADFSKENWEKIKGLGKIGKLETLEKIKNQK